MTHVWVRRAIFGQTNQVRHAAIAQAMVSESSVEVLRLDARLAASLAWIDLWLTERQTVLAQEEIARYERTLAAADARVADGSPPLLARVAAWRPAPPTTTSAPSPRRDSRGWSRGRVENSLERQMAWCRRRAFASC